MGKKSKRRGLREERLSVEAPKEVVWSAAFIQRPVIQVLMIVVIGFLVYSNTFRAPFVFDDESSIYKNIAIRDAGSFTKGAVPGILFNSRVVGQMSFALNYAVNGLNVVGYHIVNLLIHLGSALFVYWLVVLTFRTPYFSGYVQQPADGFFDSRRFVALFTALLFVSHPVQTQAVTYIVQRYASLATLFYLLSLVMYIKSRLSESPKTRYAFYALSFVAAVLSMKTKEISFTLPVMILLYEFMFFRGDIKKRLLYLVPLVLTMAIIPLSMVWGRGSLTDTGVIDKVIEGASLNIISRGDYLNTQFRVIVTYVRLLFLPINQNLDYDYPIYSTFFNPQVFLSFLFLLTVFVWGIYLVYSSFRPDKGERYWFRLFSFGIFWFFITLSVESSVIPIADVIFEHRLYLPSAGFFLAVMSGVMWMRGRFGKMAMIRKAVLPVMVIVVMGLSVTAYARNMVWQDEVTLWEDVVKKSPKKPRPNYNLGLFYSRQGRIDEAIIFYQAAIKMAPTFYRPYNDLGNAYFNKGQIDKALDEYQASVALKPDYAEVHNNIGIVYVKEGRYAEAVREFQAAIKLKPGYVHAYINLGSLHEEQGFWGDAVKIYQTALRIDPGNSKGHYNLGNVFSKQGLHEDAIREYEAAIKLQPDYAEAYYNLGNAFYNLRMLDKAVDEYKKAVMIKPAYFESYINLGNAYIDQKQLDDAIDAFKMALRINRNSSGAYFNLGNAYFQKGSFNEAVEALQASLKLNPGDVDARRNLESLYKLMKGKEKG